MWAVLWRTTIGCRFTLYNNSYRYLDINSSFTRTSWYLLFQILFLCNTHLKLTSSPLYLSYTIIKDLYLCIVLSYNIITEIVFKCDEYIK